MSERNLHPSVEEFKTFVRKHPELVKEVRRNGSNWQDYYEKWTLLGEDDPSWDKYKSPALKEKDKEEKPKKAESAKQKELMSQFMKVVDNVDLNKVQGHIHQLNGAISNIQTLIGEFQNIKGNIPYQSKGKSPFFMNKD